jgi:AcrR family transcriptional regulator
LRRDAVRSVESIAAAAVELFTERGLDCSLGEIARRAGVSPGTIYHRFGDRAGLIDAVAPQVAARKINAVINAAEREATPWERFAAYVDGLSILGGEDELLREALAGHRELTPALHAVCQTGFERGLRLMEAAHKDGALRADFSPEHLHPLLLALIGIAHTPPSSRRRVLAFILDGIRAQVSN